LVLYPYSIISTVKTQVASADVNVSEEEQIISLINDIRKSNGVRSLKLSPTLSEVADFRADDMILRNYFGHYTPEGTTVFDLMKSRKIRYKAAGENLAKGPVYLATPNNVVNAWMASETHRDIILCSKFRKVGVRIEVQVQRDEKIIVLIFKN
jgi:uncharacterized protein YkwD